MPQAIRFTRDVAGICIVGTACAAIYAADVAMTGWNPSAGFILRALIHVAELAGVIGLALSGAAGAGKLGRIGIGTAISGQVLLAAAELIQPRNPDLGDQVFNVAPMLSAIGMVLAGIAVLHAKRWTGWHRFTPLLTGLWPIVVLIPAIIISGAPPASPAVWAIAGWDLTWMLLGLALWTETAVAVRPQRSPAPASRP